MSVPMKQEPGFNDTIMLKLAREIAMDIRPVEEVLRAHEVGEDDWNALKHHPQFTRYLRQFIEEWESAVNTAERVRVKSLAMVEEALPEFYARLHDVKETLPAKTEVLKTIAKLGGLGGTVDTAMSGERMSVTINLGADHQVKIERDVTPQVIEGDRL